MADNASGFVDFEAFRGLNQDSEDKLMQEAIARAEAADAAARDSLRKVGGEARGGYGPGGGFRDPQADLTKVGSYSDYLKAKQNAAQAWAAVSQSTGDPRTDALRGGRGAQAAEMGKASASALGADFTRRAGKASAHWEGVQKWRAFLKDRDDKAAAEKAAKAEHEREFDRNFYGNLWEKLKRERGPNPTQQWRGLKPVTVYSGEDAQQWARWLVEARDEGRWQMPGMTATERQNTGKDLRGGWLERQAAGKW